MTITATGETFAASYDKDDTTAELKTATVVSSAKDDVVAPGTSDSMATMTLSGTPEVAVKVSYTGAFALDENWTVDGKFYCPLVIKVKSKDGVTEIKQNDDSINSVTAFNNAVTAAIAAYSKEYEANTNLSTVGTDSLTVTWEWPFDTNNDEKDTKLGDATTAGSVTLNVTTTVTQIN